MIDPLNVVILFFGATGMLAFFDWALPGNFRLRADQLFKRDYDEFYAAYGRGRRVRFIISLVLATLIAAASVLHDEVTFIFVVVPSIASYVILIGYYMWCAETNRTPWA